MMRLSGYVGFAWDNSGVVCNTITPNGRAIAWVKAIEGFDEACNTPFNLMSRGYDPTWASSKKKRWFKKHGGCVKDLVIEYT